MRKYALALKNGAGSQIIYLPAFLVKNLFFVIIIFIFFNLWKAIYAEKTFIAGFSMTQALWYLTFTESVELSRVRLFSQIQEEVKDGSVAYGLLRPYSYIWFVTSKTMGENIVRLFPVLVEGFVLGCLFVGILPGYFLVFPLGLALLVFALLLTTLWHVIIGLLAFWFEDAAPFYLIYQKLVFVIGGLFIPIDFFPEWLKPLSMYSPFAFTAYWPAYAFVNFSYRSLAICLTGQFFYFILLSGLAALIFHKASHRVHLQGG